MDIEKAIEDLKENIEMPFGIDISKETSKMVIECLEELRQYRQIGTVDECKTAREKQIAKTPDYEGDGYYDGKLVYDTWICPSCGEHYEVGYHDYDYCPKCGQRIQHEDWESE